MHGNYKNFTKEQVEGAILARKFQAMVAHLLDDKFKYMVSQGRPRNCDIKVKDISNTDAIFGPYLPGLRGRTVREKLERVEPQYTQIPWDFYRLHKFVTLVADVMFVNFGSVHGNSIMRYPYVNGRGITQVQSAGAR